MLILNWIFTFKSILSRIYMTLIIYIVIIKNIKLFMITNLDIVSLKTFNWTTVREIPYQTLQATHLLYTHTHTHIHTLEHFYLFIRTYSRWEQIFNIVNIYV